MAVAADEVPTPVRNWAEVTLYTLGTRSILAVGRKYLSMRAGVTFGSCRTDAAIALLALWAISFPPAETKKTVLERG